MKILIDPLTKLPMRGKSGEYFEVDHLGRVRVKRPPRAAAFIDSRGRGIPRIAGGAVGTLLYLDSFDHYDTTTLGQRKWTAINGLIVPGRNGNGLKLTSAGFAVKTLGPEYATLTMGLAYITTAFSNPIIQFSNASQGSLGVLALTHVGDGRLKALFATQAIFSGFVMNLNQYYYIEFKATLTTTGGANQAVATYTVRVNNHTIGTGTVLGNNMFGVTPLWATVTSTGPGGGDHSVIDDLYITDTELLGDVDIQVLFPAMDGDTLNWVPLAAGDHYLQVKEHTPDDLTSYNSSATPGDRDLYYLDQISGFTGTIKGAQAVWCVVKSDAGVGTVKGVLKSGGVSVLDNEYYPSDVSWLYELAPYRQSPFTALDWTIAEINAMQQGIERIT